MLRVEDKISPAGEPVIHDGVMVPQTGHAFRLETPAHDGGYAVSFSLELPALAEGANQCVIVDVDVDVESGAIGIGCLGDNLSAFVDSERILSAGPRRTVYVGTGRPGTAKHLIIRNASHHGKSVARVYGIEVLQVGVGQARQRNVQSSLWDAPVLRSAQFDKTGGDAELVRPALAKLSSVLGSDLQTLTFRIALTHANQIWDWQACTQDFFRDRYTRACRLDALPPFEKLPPARKYRSFPGRLTLFDLTMDIHGVHLAATRCLNSDYKISHACRMGDKLVICHEDYVIVAPAGMSTVDDDPGRGIERIDDPWFACLHTVFRVDDTRCVISASAADAFILLDLKQGRVVRRWRVPADRYGRNYELTEATSVQDHQIGSDIQLTHLNCAYPDGRGGFWISNLGHGDIGHVSAKGDFELIASGFIGCHGIRYSHERGCLYFSDSCNGRLISIGADRVPRTIGVVDSCWLHDAQHLAGDIFVLSLADKNAIAVFDSSSNREIARFDMKARGERVQFINLASTAPRQLQPAIPASV